jgi:hypothetical protein
MQNNSDVLIFHFFAARGLAFILKICPFLMPSACVGRWPVHLLQQQNKA